MRALCFPRKLNGSRPFRRTRDRTRIMSTTAAVASTKNRTAWFFLLLALASLMWSAQGTAIKILDRHLGPIAITFLPFYVTTLLFVPLLLKMRRERPDAQNPSAKE